MFSFEVKESDLLGRIGALKVSGRTLETPYMFPVIHPVSQIVPTGELLSMGFGGIMTNSYIIYSRRREEAVAKGVHRLVDFEGVVMTDSGGYQVLEYGDLEIDYQTVAGFQSKIGSDLAVTLDRPTGYPQSRSVAKETVEYSLKNARATLEGFGESATTWVGPVQGGLYGDLVSKSAKAMVASGFQILALGSPVQVMESYMFADLVDMVMAAKRAIPYSVPLHLFGAGHPLTMPLAVALGCDTFDSASYVIFARTGRYMTRSGVLTLKSMKYLPCSCPACAATSVKELLEMDHQERTRALSLHNLFVLREEIEGCKEAVSEGRLWDLVEERSMAHPKLRDAFARLVKYSKDMEVGTPAIKDRGLFVRSTLDFARPELSMARERLAGAVARTSKSARLVSGAKGELSGSGDDAYGVHPVLGPFPIELQFQYPFSQTESAQAQSLPADPKKELRAMGYRRVTIQGEAKPKRARSRRSRRGASPSPRASSARSR
ncbi:MAG TPA: tRNA guanosine(15) transglycosylase TgtA [Nitrososphaerales archaeon]|nr:tRNA guanosine(15) transglycosylase TgtA [Nitrososphaerales archaeon]